MEEKLNKKFLLIILKYAPWLILLLYLASIALTCFGVYPIILITLSGSSVLPFTVIILFSKLLGFCIWHRLPLYYVMCADIVNLIDCYIGLPIINTWMFVVYMLMMGMTILIGMYVKNRRNVRKRNPKESST